MSVIENESTGIDPHHLLGIGIHILGHHRGIGKGNLTNWVIPRPNPNGE
jgi:hypothetical protein